MATTLGVDSRQPVVTNWGCIVLVLGGTLIATLPTWLGIGRQWTIMDGGYSHGFLTLAVFGWLLWNMRGTLNSIPARTSLPGGVCVVLVLLALLAGQTLLIEALEQLAAFTLPFALIWALLGWRVVRHLILPAGILFAAIPVWDLISYPLQSLTVAIDHMLLGLSDIRFQVNDVFVTLEGLGTFEIARGCSGLRYFLVGLVVAQMYAALYVASWPRRLGVIAIGILLSLAANWLRVYFIILIGYYTDMQSSLIRDHEAFGWFLFAGMLVLFYFIAHRLETADIGGTNDRGVPPQALSRPALRVAAVVVVGLLAGGSYILNRHTDSGIVPAAMVWPAELGQFKKLPILLDAPWQPEWQGADRTARAAYVEKGKQTPRVLHVYAYWYDRQSPGRELVQEANRIYDSFRWLLLTRQRRTLPDGNFGLLRIRHINDQTDRLIAYAYQVGDRFYDDSILAKLAQFGLLGRADKSVSIWFASVACSPVDCDEDSADLLVNTLRQLGHPL